MPKSFKPLIVVIMASADMALASQVIVAGDVGFGFLEEGQSGGRVVSRWRLGFQQPAQEIQNMRFGDGPGFECQFDRAHDSVLVVVQNEDRISTISRSPPSRLSSLRCRALEGPRQLGEWRAKLANQKPPVARQAGRRPRPAYSIDGLDTPRKTSGWIGQGRELLPELLWAE
jgi:hypothetical protein